MAKESLEAKVEAMEKELTRLRGIEAIRRVEHAYNWYLVQWMPDEIVDLFADREDISVEFPEGTFIGKKGVDHFYRFVNPNHNPEVMHQMMHMSDIIDISEDGKTGKGRWWGFGAIAIPRRGESDIVAAMVCGIYENDFIKENGTWKLWKLKWTPLYYFLPEVSWVDKEKLAEPGPPLPLPEGEVGVAEGLKYDIPPKKVWYSYPSGYIMPFHFKHPVTGKETGERKLNKRVKNIEND
jgi:hypothetical protein